MQESSRNCLMKIASQLAGLYFANIFDKSTIVSIFENISKQLFSKKTKTKKNTSCKCQFLFEIQYHWSKHRSYEWTNLVIPKLEWNFSQRWNFWVTQFKCVSGAEPENIVLPMVNEFVARTLLKWYPNCYVLVWCEKKIETKLSFNYVCIISSSWFHLDQYSKELTE